MISVHGANPIFLIKKTKIGRPEHSLTLHLLRPITFHFCHFLSPIPSPRPQSGRYMCITPNRVCVGHESLIYNTFKSQKHLLIDLQIG